MRLVDAIGRVEPSWVEAVAVVQAVCARLEPGQAPPALDDILVSKAGRVSFPPPGRAVADRAVGAAGQLLTAILGQGVCPMPVWDATELARRSPHTFGSVRAFGASLTCLPVTLPFSLSNPYFFGGPDLVRAKARGAVRKRVRGMGLAMAMPLVPLAS